MYQNIILEKELYNILLPKGIELKNVITDWSHIEYFTLKKRISVCVKGDVCLCILLMMYVFLDTLQCQNTYRFHLIIIVTMFYLISFF